MAANIEQAGPISVTPDYKIPLSKIKPELVQKIIVLRDLLRTQLRTVAESKRDPEPCLKCVQLKEESSEAKDSIRRFTDGQPKEWGI